MKKQEMMDKLRRIGLKKTFNAYQEPEHYNILLKTRKTVQIVDGWLTGSEIDIYDDHTFRVWTPKTRKATACAIKYGLKIRKIDGEAELFIPIFMADELLPLFGAKVKRHVSE